jgi:Family of unknown function (DUF6524)
MTTRSKFFAKFVARLAAAILIVFSTFNPTGYSYVHWVLNADGDHPVLKLMFGLALFMLYYALLSITLGAFRRTGMMVGTIASVLFATKMVLLATPQSLYQSWNGNLLIGEYVMLLSFAIVLAVGVSWSAFMERLTGQQQKRYVARPPATPVR